MKFENKHLRVIIEKKKRSQEEKEAGRLKARKRLPYAATALILTAAITIGVVCAHIWDIGGGTEGTYVDAARMASGIQDKYGGQGLYPYTYGDPIEDLGRDETIELQMEYDVMSLEGIGYWYEVCGVYQDPELTQRVKQVEYGWDGESRVLSIMPPTSSINLISINGLAVDVVSRYSHSQYTLFDQGNGADWGNLKTLYLACHYDPHTGEKLDQPIVSIITRKGELEETPRLSYTISSDGRPEFTWTPVEGATDYIVCEATYSEEDGYTASLSALAAVNGLTWTTEMPGYSSMPAMNQELRTFRISEDEWKDESTYDHYKDQYEPGQVVDKESEWGDPGICVIAVGEEGTSMASNVFMYHEIAPNLPYATAVYTKRDNGITGQYEDIRELPIYDYVVMCDGIVNKKLIDYYTEDAKVISRRFVEFGNDGEVAGGEDMLCLEIPYVVEGTPFSYSMSVIGYEEGNLEEDLEFLEERQSALRKKSGDISLVADRELAMEEMPKRGAKQIRQLKNTEIFANSALSEYLAANMLGGVENIDISAFPEARDTDFAEDAFLEAYYQNPLILGIQGYRIDRRGTEVWVYYDDNARTQAKKQEKIREKILQVIPKIIKPRMSDEEKELAINQYLCDTITYDEDALVSAEENDFLYVDERYNDSFTAYGALVNGKCVCAGYAAAFKLLADAAGLDSIVVTGFLEGSLSHAWNKVKIENEWQIVDVTNNDNEDLINALLNLPSFVGDRVLVEDKNYMLDKEIGNYTGTSEKYEYYHRTESFFPVEEIAAELAEDIQDDGKALLRTDYDLDDEEFYQIAGVVYELLGDDIELYGYYWLGVIYITTEQF